MVENDKSIKCTKFRKIDQNVDYVSMWCGRRFVALLQEAHFPKGIKQKPFHYEMRAIYLH